MDLPSPGPAGAVVPGIGRCVPDSRGYLDCYSPFPRAALAMFHPGAGIDWGFSGDSEDTDAFTAATRWHWIERLDSTYSPASRLVTYHIVGRRSATLDLPNVRLADYLAR